MTEKYLGGASYFVTFIDDYSRKVWVFLLKTKDQVLDMFKQFHVKLEEYCRKYGIKHERTIPKAPQQNDLAERMNLTITEKVLSMLFDAYLPKYFWAEAVRLQFI